MQRACLLALLIMGCTVANAQTFFRGDLELRTGPKPSSIAVGDLNGDGIPDIVSADRGTLRDPTEEKPANDQLSLFLSTGTMEYAPQPQLRTGFGPYAVLLSNIDALKALDILAVSFLASRDRDLALFRNLGEGLFEPHYFSVADDAVRYERMRDGQNDPVFTVPGLTAFAVRDFDGDGLRDVVATAWSSDVLVHFRGHIDTYFSKPTVLNLPGAPRALCIGDFNDDGAGDVAVSLEQDNAIAVLDRDEDGVFFEVSRFASRGTEPGPIVAADMDRDGKQDLVVAHSRAEDSIVIFRSDGDFGFSLSQEIALGEMRVRTEVGIRSLVAADLDRDGDVDLAVAGAVSQTVHVLINKGDRGFPLAFDIEQYRFEDAEPLALAVDDFNKDDKPDLAVALGNRDRITFLLGR